MRIRVRRVAAGAVLPIRSMLGVHDAFDLGVHRAGDHLGPHDPVGLERPQGMTEARGAIVLDEEVREPRGAISNGQAERNEGRSLQGDGGNSGNTASGGAHEVENARGLLRVFAHVKRPEFFEILDRLIGHVCAAPDGLDAREYREVVGCRRSHFMLPDRRIPMNLAEVRQKLKELIVTELNLEGKSPDDIEDTAPLFGEGLGLDSLDALQLAMSIEEAFGVRIPEGDEARSIFASVEAIAAHIVRTKAPA